MEQYERKVRTFLKTLDMFFDTRGLNAEELDRQKRWLEAYHEKLDRQRNDEAERLQTKLKL